MEKLSFFCPKAGAEKVRELRAVIERESQRQDGRGIELLDLEQGLADRSEAEARASTHNALLYTGYGLVAGGAVAAGTTLLSADSTDKSVKAKGTKTEQANIVGKALAEKAIAAGITQCIFDRNGYLYHGRIKSLAEGAREGGLKF